MPSPRSNLTALSLTLATALTGAAACSHTDIETNSGATSGSTSTAGPGGTGGQGGAGATGGASSSSSSTGVAGMGGAAPVDASWQVTAIDDIPGGATVAADSAGNVIVAGSYQDAIDLGGGPLLVGMGTGGGSFLAKFDATKHLLWSHSFDNAGISVAVDGLDDVVIAGSFYKTTDLGGGPITDSVNHSALYVAKFDPDGNYLYSRSFSSADASVQLPGGLAVDAAGDIYLTGGFSGSLDFGGGPLPYVGDGQALFVVELDPAGQHVWSRSFGDDDSNIGQSIAVSPDGHVAVTGSYTAGFNLGGGPLPPIDDPYGKATFLLGLDASGGYELSQGVNCKSATPVFDGEGNLYVACSFTGSVDFGGGALSSGYFIHLAVAKFDPGHQLLWSEQFGDIGTTLYGTAAFPGGGDSLLIAGYGTGKVDFGGGELAGGAQLGGFVARLDASGHHLWSRGFNGTGNVYGTGAAVGPTGDVFYTGYFDGTVDLIDGPTTNQGKKEDFFLLKIVP